jgi:hypothetical protein
MKPLNIIILFTMATGMLLTKPQFTEGEEEIIVKSDAKIEKVIELPKNDENNRIKFGEIEIKKDIITVGKIKSNKDKFLDGLAKSESRGDYGIANKYRYVGKYQFGRIALREIGYSNEKINKIMSSVYFDHEKNQWRFNQDYFTPQEQEEAIEVFMSRLEQIYLKKEISKYVGKTINGIKITKPGLLAGAHLGGAKSVKIFLTSNGRINKHDAFGTSVRDYIKMFENLDMKYNFTKKEKIKV